MNWKIEKLSLLFSTRKTGSFSTHDGTRSGTPGSSLLAFSKHGAENSRGGMDRNVRPSTLRTSVSGSRHANCEQ